MTRMRYQTRAFVRCLIATETCWLLRKNTTYNIRSNRSQCERAFESVGFHVTCCFNGSRRPLRSRFECTSVTMLSYHCVCVYMYIKISTEKHKHVSVLRRSRGFFGNALREHHEECNFDLSGFVWLIVISWMGLKFVFWYQVCRPSCMIAPSLCRFGCDFYRNGIFCANLATHRDAELYTRILCFLIPKPNT